MHEQFSYTDHRGRACTLTYLRPAVASQDGYDGLMYHHDYTSGFQELIFPTPEAAARFADTETRAPNKKKTATPLPVEEE